MNDKLVYSCWCCFVCDWIVKIKGDLLDIFWLKDKDSLDVVDLLEFKELVDEVKVELILVLVELDELLVVFEEVK